MQVGAVRPTAVRTKSQTQGARCGPAGGTCGAAYACAKTRVGSPEVDRASARRAPATFARSGASGTSRCANGWLPAGRMGSIITPAVRDKEPQPAPRQRAASPHRVPSSRRSPSANTRPEQELVTVGSPAWALSTSIVLRDSSRRSQSGDGRPTRTSRPPAEALVGLSPSVSGFANMAIVCPSTTGYDHIRSGFRRLPTSRCRRSRQRGPRPGTAYAGRRGDRCLRSRLRGATLHGRGLARLTADGAPASARRDEVSAARAAAPGPPSRAGAATARDRARA